MAYLNEIPSELIDKYIKEGGRIQTFKRHHSVHQIPGGKVYGYPQWFYKSREQAQKRKICRVCGEKLPKGKRVFCGTDCQWEWSQRIFNSLGTNSIRREIHNKFNYTCQGEGCGLMFVNIIKASGVAVIFWGGEVHHIIPLEDGGLDEWDNLTLYCHDCHKDEHTKINAKKKAIKEDSNTIQAEIDWGGETV